MGTRHCHRHRCVTMTSLSQRAEVVGEGKGENEVLSLSQRAKVVGEDKGEDKVSSLCHHNITMLLSHKGPRWQRVRTRCCRVVTLSVISHSGHLRSTPTTSAPVPTFSYLLLYLLHLRPPSPHQTSDASPSFTSVCTNLLIV